jgi:prepilin-type N-terminal cleavage/methylation domain-containing protein
MTLSSSFINRTTARCAFTLAELLVVLAILAVMTTVAVQSLAPVATQARTDATQRTITNVRDAIITYSPTSAAGFLVDVGRPPLSISELLVPINSADAMPLVNWKGPYVLLPVGATTLSALADAWGNPLSLDPLGISIASSGDRTSSGSSPISASIPWAAMHASTLTMNFSTSRSNSSITGGTATISYPIPSGNTTTFSAVVASGGVGTTTFATTPELATGTLYLTDPLWIGQRGLLATLTITSTTTTPAGTDPDGGSIPATTSTSLSTSTVECPIFLRPGQNTFNFVVP